MTVRLLVGDDLWEGAQPGWYLFPNGDDGDSIGPFDTEDEARGYVKQELGDVINFCQIVQEVLK